MDKNSINSHDKFFKELFSKKEEVVEFVAKTFPPQITANLDFNSLELDKTEYIDSKLRTNYSDIVYNCTYAQNTKIKITLLFEHKSYPEQFPHLQLLGYMLKIWEIQIKQKQQLTPIIPIIFYHGQKRWVFKSFDQYFKGVDENLQKFIPKFDYQLIDTSNFKDDDIIELFESLQLQIGILLMKNIYNEQKILQEINKFFADVNKLLQTENGEQFFETIVAYLLYSTRIDTVKYVENMRTISHRAEEKFISTAMRLKMEGRMEGRMEGKMEGRMEGLEKGIKKVAYNLIHKGLDNDFIKQTTGLSDEQINYLRKMESFELDLENSI